MVANLLFCVIVLDKFFLSFLFMMEPVLSKFDWLQFFFRWKRFLVYGLNV
uniref:Uncharacterized protein n=1 Tax=Rhizophora mucronata TaxID=61149 RepID=A0A2P2PCB3_RHIMU